MTAQNLSSKEFETCAALYATKNSVLFSLHFVADMNTEQFATLSKIKLHGKTFWGEWWGRPFCTACSETIRSLLGRGLIMLQEDYGQEYYILNVCEEYKEFFEELEVQIALGSI